MIKEAFLECVKVVHQEIFLKENDTRNYFRRNSSEARFNSDIFKNKNTHRLTRFLMCKKMHKLGCKFCEVSKITEFLTAHLLNKNRITRAFTMSLQLSKWCILTT